MQKEKTIVLVDFKDLFDDNNLPLDEFFTNCYCLACDRVERCLVGSNFRIYTECGDALGSVSSKMVNLPVSNSVNLPVSNATNHLPSTITYNKVFQTFQVKTYKQALYKVSTPDLTLDQIHDYLQNLKILG